jgi:hypothetical protein
MEGFYFRKQQEKGGRSYCRLSFFIFEVPGSDPEGPFQI